jgi:hypothetical protein
MALGTFPARGGSCLFRPWFLSAVSALQPLGKVTEHTFDPPRRDFPSHFVVGRFILIRCADPLAERDLTARG